MSLDDRLEALERIERLYSAGILDEDELQTAKRNVLAGRKDWLRYAAGVAVGALAMTALPFLGVSAALPARLLQPTKIAVPDLPKRLTGKWYYTCDTASYWRSFDADGGYADANGSKGKWRLEGNLLYIDAKGSTVGDDEVAVAINRNGQLIVGNYQAQTKCDKLDAYGSPTDGAPMHGEHDVDQESAGLTNPLLHVTCETANGGQISVSACIRPASQTEIMIGALSISDGISSKSYAGYELSQPVQLPQKFRIIAESEPYYVLRIRVTDGDRTLFERTVNGDGRIDLDSSDLSAG